MIIAYQSLDDNLNVVPGEVLLHSPNADDIYDALSQYNDRSVAIEYVGGVLEDEEKFLSLDSVENLSEQDIVERVNRSN